MRKVYKKIADADGVVDKLFVGDKAPTPAGWHDTIPDALREPEKRGPGRPRKMPDDDAP